MNNTTSSLEQPPLLDESDELVATTIEESTEATEPSLATTAPEEATIEEIATEETIVDSAEIVDNEFVDQTLEEPLETSIEEATESLLETSSVEESADEMTAEETTVDSSKVASKNVVDQIGQLTRTLHNSLRELGYDKRLEDISAEVPEAQDKLTYIATKAEQAAERVLNATEIAMPIQEELSSASTNLSEQWKQALESQESSPDDAEKYKNLIINTLSYLDNVPKQADATNAQLMEIMMAQDFQDLTGQVVSKVTKMVKDLEFELLQLLVANVPPEKRIGINEGLMNGPVVNPEKRDDVVSNQEQVDDLLASMGF
ncbi:MAG: protein phosphatase CheZ [Nitrosomonas sp.]|nr:protein phosphatase CheZ [Nitrosomonas sp.]